MQVHLRKAKNEEKRFDMTDLVVMQKVVGLRHSRRRPILQRDSLICSSLKALYVGSSRAFLPVPLTVAWKITFAERRYMFQ